MEEKALTTKEKKYIEKEVATLLDKLSISATSSLEEKDGVLVVTLETEESGIVIGYHGEGLEALQLIISLLVAKKLDRFVRISLEVGDYRKNREEYLRQLAVKMKEKAIQQQTEQEISSLKAWERRVIHLFLQDDPHVSSESMGEGRERVLVIKPK